MNRDEKAAAIEEVAGQIRESEAVYAVDYRGITVTQIAELRGRLAEADASLRVVKNRLTQRSADQAGAESLKEVLEGPTAFAFVRGDAALAAKAIATFRREHEVPQFKGGTLNGEALTIDQIEDIAKLPARNVLDGQLVGVLASPVTSLVRGLNQLIAGLAIQLGAIADQGLVGGDAPAAEPAEEAPAGEAPTPTEEAPADVAPAEAEAEATTEETSGDSPAETDENSEAPSGDANTEEG